MTNPSRLLSGRNQMKGKISRILMAILVFFLLGVTIPVCSVSADSSTVVTFPDPNLEPVIRTKIGKLSGDIYQSDLLVITSLTAEGKGITNLSGIEFCTNLESLNLNNYGKNDLERNRVSDITVLANLIHLSYLYLFWNEIGDVSALANLTQLRQIDLAKNHITNISALANLTNLQSLNLQVNQISNISILANLTNLTELVLGDNQITDVSILANLTNLRSLSLGKNQISNVSGLALLTNLWYLDLDQNQIVSITPLANLIALQRLFLGYNSVGNISPLSNLTNLQYLILTQNNISDISVLTNKSDLFQLYLSNNQITDISPLANLTKLDELFLYSNKITNITPLANLTNLKELYLGDNQINDISSLANLTALRRLDLWQTHISDISALTNLINLQDLFIASNQISNISVLANLTNLHQLSLVQNQITDISALAQLIHLSYVTLFDNQISDVSSLEQLTNLSNLDLRRNHISDISALALNLGIGSGDLVYIEENYLDITSGSLDMEDIQTLIGRGVTVYFQGQKTYGLTINISPLGSGTVTKDKLSPYYYGEEVTLTPTASAGHTFSNFSTNVNAPTHKVTITDNTTVTATFTLNTPDIRLEGNSTEIVRGDASPSVSDFTNFGSTAVAGGTVNRTYTIKNTGDATLTLSGTPKVSLSGSNAADFSVTTQPLSPVAAGDNTTFTLRFDPSATGLRTATISIANNDSDENPYTFAIQGSGINTYALTMAAFPGGGGTTNDLTAASPYAAGATISIQAVAGTGYHFVHWNAAAGTFVDASLATTTFTMPAANAIVTASFAINSPEIKIEGNSTEIVSGDVTPSTGDFTDFGNVVVASGTVNRTYVIKNTGDATLTLSGTPKVSLSGANAADFSVITQPLSPVAAGNNTTFTVRFDPSATGVRKATISIANNDSDENPYTFAIQGTGLPPSITVTSPNGGENWEAGSSQTLTWSSVGITGNLNILISRNGGTSWTTIFTNTPNDGKQAWTVTGPATVQAIIKVASVTSPTVSDTSNANFSIVQAITVTSPHGGENWVVGSTQNITWSSVGFTGNVNISISRNSGTTWSTIISNMPDDGSQVWKVTGTATTQAKIKVASVSTPIVFDISDANISIIPPTLTVTSPNGGENWEAGSSQALTWSSVGITGNLNILISRNGGTSWTTIFTNTPNDGTQIWTVTGTATTQGRIKVVSVTSPTVFDISTANFNIIPTLTVTSPNGGENWSAGSARSITWKSSGVTGYVNIQLSRDGGTNWTTIISNTTNDCSQGRIKVVSVTSPTVFDISTAN